MTDDSIFTAISCPHCKAGVGDLCVTSKGTATNRWHTARKEPLLRAYRLGYLDAHEVRQGSTEYYETLHLLRKRRGQHE